MTRSARWRSSCRAQLGFSDTQIGTLNAIYSLPNIFMVLIGGVLVDRFSARSVTLVTTLVCLLGAMLTALGEQFAVMAAGRLLFGIGAETMIVATIVALAQWFAGRYLALLMALSITFARLGSYLADRSPSYASDLYSQGWQPPLWLAAGFGLIAVAGATAYWLVDRREAARGTLAIPPPGERFDWKHLLSFRAEYWFVVAVCVAFYSVIFPFRSTFSIKFFQEAHGLTLEAASILNSHVFLAAMIATPVFGFMVDRWGRHGMLLALGALALPLSFVLLGSSGHAGARRLDRLAGCELLAGAGGVVARRDPARARRASRHRIRTHDGPATGGSLPRQTFSPATSMTAAVRVPRTRQATTRCCGISES